METLCTTSGGTRVLSYRRVADRRDNAVALIIDEDLSTRALLRLHLANAGYVVLEAMHAVQGAYLALSASPELILCDVGTCRLVSGDFLAALKSGSTTRRSSLVLLTADPDADRRSHELAGASFLRKPVDAERLLEMIEAAR